MNKRIHPLVLSFLIHASILCVVLLLVRPIPPLATPTVATFDVVGSSRSIPPRANVPPHAPSKPAPRTLNFGDVAIGKSGATDSHKPSLDTPSENGFETAQTMDLGTESKLYPFFHALWQRIDASLGYPKDFVNERIDGSVQLQFEVDERGTMTGKIAALNSDSKYLKAYVLAILVHALKAPLPEKNWSALGKITLVAKFDFDIFTVGHTTLTRGEHLKNFLSFRRSAHVQPKLNQFIEKVYQRYMPPVIVIPGAFYIDFYRAYQMIESMGKPDADDRRKDRIQLDLDEWQRAVRKL